MPIVVPIEIGDVILTGKFKNHRVTVQEIGTDDYGLPTVNGKGIMKIRVQKLMPKKENIDMRVSMKLRDVYKSILKESTNMKELMAFIIANRDEIEHEYEMSGTYELIETAFPNADESEIELAVNKVLGI